MAKKKTQTFEEQLERLEEIVEMLDTGEEPLEKLIDIYKEGKELSASLKKFLEVAEQKIVEIGGD